MSVDSQADSPVKSDIQAIREAFPILGTRIHGQRLCYLDNAATTQKPECVLAAMDRCYREYYGNIHRAVHQLSQESTLQFENARKTIASFLGSPDADQVVFTRGATEAINLVAYSAVLPHLREGDEVLITAMEHHANLVPWQQICQAKGANLKVLPMSDRAELRLDLLDTYLTDRTRLFAFVHVSNAFGTVNPAKQMIKQAHDRGVPVLLDASQSVVHFPLNVQNLDCDYLVFSGHKLFGPTGIGILYGKREKLEVMEPWQYGGDMIQTVAFEETRFRAPPARFEAGTPPIVEAIGLGEAVRFLQRLDRQSLYEQEAHLSRIMLETLSGFEGLRLVGEAEDRCGIFSMVLEGCHPHDLGTLLDSMGVAVRTGNHCVQPGLNALGYRGTLRASLSIYNEEEDIHQFSRALKKSLRMLK